MRRLLKSFLIIVLIVFFTLAAIIFLKGGDFLIYYLGDCLGFRLEYANRCNFLQAFIFKTASLKDPVLKSLEFPFEISCRDALIQFDYSELLSKGGIELRCHFDKPKFAAKSMPQKSDMPFMDFIPKAVGSLLEESSNFTYDSIYCNIFIYGDTAEVLNFRAESKDIILIVRGKAADKGSIDAYLKVFFSPAFSAGFPEEASMFLEKNSEGWMSFAISLKTDMNKPFLKLERDVFKFTINEIESK